MKKFGKVLAGPVLSILILASSIAFAQDRKSKKEIEDLAYDIATDVMLADGDIETITAREIRKNTKNWHKLDVEKLKEDVEYELDTFLDDDW